MLEERALASAEKLQLKIDTGRKVGKLAGIIFAVKDNINVKGSITSCGSFFLSNYQSVYNASVIKELLAEYGIIIGKNNMDEFGIGSSSVNSAYGPVKNPIDRSFVAGGGIRWINSSCRR